DREAKERAAREAERHLLTARRALSHMNRLASEFSFEPRMEATWRDLLRDSTQFFLELHATRPEEPTVQKEMGQTFARLGMAHRRLGDTNEALRTFPHAIELLEGLTQQSALDVPTRILLVQTYQHYGWELSVAKRRPERVAAHRSALAQAEKLAAELPSPRHRDLLANCCSVLGVTLIPSDPDEAETLFLRATKLLSEPGMNQHFLGKTWLALGELQKDKPSGRTDAEKSLRKAIEVLTPTVAKSTLAWQSRDRLADARVHLGRVLAVEGRFTDAIVELRQAVEIRDKQVADFSNVPSYRDDQIVARVELARVMAINGQVNEARIEFEKIASHTPQGAAACSVLAGFLAGCTEPTFRNPPRAVELAEKAVALAPEFAAHWQVLGAAHIRHGNTAKAISALTTAIARRPTGNGFDPFYLALAHGHQGDSAEAKQWYTKATEWANQYAPKDPELARLRSEVAVLLGNPLRLASPTDQDR
ncbi:MAG: hypothetical protein ACRCZF_22255, partial [Gemmataceae bacterium]